MERFFYHGLGDFSYEDTLDLVLDIIKSGGLKTRSSVRGHDDNYSHVCLYKKNDDYDYTKLDTIFNSARGGWIDHCVFFIVSPDVVAEKVTIDDGVGFYDDGKSYTDLIDEWRSEGDIGLDKIIGIAFPFDSMEEDKRLFPEEYTDSFYEKLNQIIEFANSRCWLIENSDKENLCDSLDEMLSKDEVSTKVR